MDVRCPYASHGIYIWSIRRCQSLAAPAGRPHMPGTERVHAQAANMRIRFSSWFATSVVEFFVFRQLSNSPPVQPSIFAIRSRSISSSETGCNRLRFATFPARPYAGSDVKIETAQSNGGLAKITQRSMAPLLILVAITRIQPPPFVFFWFWRIRPLGFHVVEPRAYSPSRQFKTIFTGN